MVTINAQQLTNGWAVTVSCLSTDDKPTVFSPPGVFPAGLVPMPNGALLLELDTGKTYRFDANSDAWFPQPAAQDEAVGLGLTGASVGDLVRVNAVDSNGKPTSWKHVPLNEIKCNKNLLDNWYFVGGGSQLGDGVFPINQRGQATYSGVGYGIDRWNSQVSNLALEILPGYISLDFKRQGSPFRQICNSTIGLAGKTVTFSILAKGENIRLAISAYDGISFTKHFVSKSFAGDANTFKIYSVTAVLENLLSTESLSVQLYSTTTEFSPILCKAVKLELGSEQTLAHNEGTEENPVWVLNEIPDYGEELAKCQRYYQLFRTESLRPTYGEDCRPTMATEQPTKGTLTKGGVTYYALSSES